MTDAAVQELSKSARIKQKAIHEMKEVAIVVAYLALFLFAFATYKMLLLHQFRSALVEYGTALFSAMVLSKVIILGQALKLGKRSEQKPLLYVSILKAVIFAALIVAFKVVEEIVKGIFHGETFAEALRVISGRRALELVVMGIVSFCVFIPFFALMETRRVLGPGQLGKLFLHGRVDC
jgi:hypothetical protein